MSLAELLLNTTTKMTLKISVYSFNKDLSNIYDHSANAEKTVIIKFKKRISLLSY